MRPASAAAFGAPATLTPANVAAGASWLAVDAAGSAYVVYSAAGGAISPAGPVGLSHVRPGRQVRPAGRAAGGLHRGVGRLGQPRRSPPSAAAAVGARC